MKIKNLILKHLFVKYFNAIMLSSLIWDNSKVYSTYATIYTYHHQTKAMREFIKFFNT